MSDRPANEGGQPPVGPSAPTETQPTDPTIPQGWERSAQKAKEEPSSDVKTVVRAGKRCRTWLVTRTIHGPKRNGKCIPVGAPVLIAWYLGNCDWAIHQIQYGTANEYQLVNVIGVRITACDDSTTEEIVDRMTPFWKSLGPHRTVCSDTVITKVHGERPLGSDDCPKYWQPDIHGGLPSSVKDALQREADKLKPTSPGLTTMPYPLGSHHLPSRLAPPLVRCLHRRRWHDGSGSVLSEMPSIRLAEKGKARENILTRMNRSGREKPGSYVKGCGKATNSSGSLKGGVERSSGNFERVCRTGACSSGPMRGAKPLVVPLQEPGLTTGCNGRRYAPPLNRSVRRITPR